MPPSALPNPQTSLAQTKMHGGRCGLEEPRSGRLMLSPRQAGCETASPLLIAESITFSFFFFSRELEERDKFESTAALFDSPAKQDERHVREAAPRDGSIGAVAHGGRDRQRAGEIAGAARDCRAGPPVRTPHSSPFPVEFVTKRVMSHTTELAICIQDHLISQQFKECLFDGYAGLGWS